MVANHTKKIPFGEMTEELKNHITSAITNLESLKSEINDKVKIITEKQELLSEKINNMESSDTIKVKPGATKQLLENKTNYATISEMFKQEIDAQINHFSKYLTNEHPKEIEVLSQDTFQDHVIKAEKLLKRFIKKRSTELNVLFSRYDNNFSSQIKQLQSLEMMINTKK